MKYLWYPCLYGLYHCLRRLFFSSEWVALRSIRLSTSAGDGQQRLVCSVQTVHRLQWVWNIGVLRQALPRSYWSSDHVYSIQPAHWSLLLVTCSGSLYDRGVCVCRVESVLAKSFHVRDTLEFQANYNLYIPLISLRRLLHLTPEDFESAFLLLGLPCTQPCTQPCTHIVWMGLSCVFVVQSWTSCWRGENFILGAYIKRI